MIDLTAIGIDHAIQGAIGGFIGAISKDGEALRLPRITRSAEDTLLKLGFIGGILIGAFAGYVIDHNPAVAGLAGFLGIKAINYAIRKFLPDLEKGLEDGRSQDSGSESPLQQAVPSKSPSKGD